MGTPITAFTGMGTNNDSKSNKLPRPMHTSRSHYALQHYSDGTLFPQQKRAHMFYPRHCCDHISLSARVCCLQHVGTAC